MKKTIIAAVDFEDNARLVLKKAIAMAKVEKAELIIAYVQPIIVPIASTESLPITNSISDVSSEERLKLDEYLKLAQYSSITDVSVVVEYSVNVISAIVDEIADRYQADLIVCGSSNRHGLSGFILGSVSAGISKHAKCDVYVVKKKLISTSY